MKCLLPQMLIVLALLPDGLPWYYHGKDPQKLQLVNGNCFDGGTSPVNLHINFDGNSCYDTEGNEYQTSHSLHSCCGCVKLTCTTAYEIHGSPSPRLTSFWKKYVGKYCCEDCLRKGVPVGNLMNSQHLKDKCLTTVTKQCVMVNKGNKSEVVITEKFSYKSCCPDPTGLHSINTTILEPESCSSQQCIRPDGSMFARWKTSILHPGCHCCLHQGELIPNGGNVSLANGKNATCCEGELLVTYQTEGVESPTTTTMPKLPSTTATITMTTTTPTTTTTTTLITTIEMSPKTTTTSTLTSTAAKTTSRIPLTDAINAVEGTVHGISDILNNFWQRRKRQAETFSEDENKLLGNMDKLLEYLKTECISESGSCNSSEIEIFRQKLESIFNNITDTGTRNPEFKNTFEEKRHKFDELIKQARELIARCVTYSYPDSFELNQTLSVPVGQSIEVTFLDFDIETDDYLEFFDGHGNSYATRSSPRNFTILSSTASVVFHSDESSSKKGFKFCYKSGTLICLNEEKADTPCMCREEICSEGDTCSSGKCFIDCEVKIAKGNNQGRKHLRSGIPQVCSTPPIKNFGNWQCSDDKKLCHLKCNPGYASLFSSTTCSGGLWTELDKMECEPSVYLLVGDNTDTNDPKKTNDIYHPVIKDLTCSKYSPKLNKNWEQHVTFVYNGVVYVCGGRYTQHKCASLNITDPSYQWKVHDISNIKDHSLYSAVVLQNNVYFVGGVSVINGARRTSLPLETKPSFTSLPYMAYNGREGQCVIKIDENAFIVTGGRGNYSKKAIKYNTTEQMSTILPDMLEERAFHGCVMVEEGGKQWIVVAGGHLQVSGILNTTERLDINSGTHWESFGHLNTRRELTIMDEVGSGIIVFGGINSGGKLDTLETLDWNTQQWKISEKRLKTGISSVGVVKVPKSVFDCDIPDEAEFNYDMMSVGTIVVRNDQDWIWLNEDGGSGNQGIIKEGGTDNGWILVEWMNNNVTKSYRWGADGKADIKIYSKDNCETAMVVNTNVVANGSLGTIVGRYDFKLEVKLDGKPWSVQTHNYTWNYKGQTNVNVSCEKEPPMSLSEENNVDIAHKCCFIIRSGQSNGTNQTYILTNPFYEGCSGTSKAGDCAYTLYTPDENFCDISSIVKKNQICLDTIKNPVCCSQLNGALCQNYGTPKIFENNISKKGKCSNICKEIADCSSSEETEQTKNWCGNNFIVETNPQDQDSSGSGPILDDNSTSRASCTAKNPPLAAQSAVLYPQALAICATGKRSRTCGAWNTWIFTCWHMYGYTKYQSGISWFEWKDWYKFAGKYKAKTSCYYYKDNCCKDLQALCCDNGAYCGGKCEKKGGICGNLRGSIPSDSVLACQGRQPGEKCYKPCCETNENGRCCKDGATCNRYGKCKRN